MNPVKELQLELKERIGEIFAEDAPYVKAFAEDTATVVNDVLLALKGSGAIVAVVTTPSFERDGSSARGIPASARVEIRASEIPEINRKQPGHDLTALDVAHAIAKALDSENMNFISISQSADASGQLLTATAVFQTSIML